MNTTVSQGQEERGDGHDTSERTSKAQQIIPNANSHQRLKKIPSVVWEPEMDTYLPQDQAEVFRRSHNSFFSIAVIKIL